VFLIHFDSEQVLAGALGRREGVGAGAGLGLGAVGALGVGEARIECRADVCNLGGVSN
jgi:hypothetical protein